eukprot:gb/GEZN01004294.1/.p1 GENE.gb/GEZN01004294.1/~~gb/GEZN01004294.1/.p1  ORF type:complete len:434 (+),score=67.40 gb/GEZN01004294.1/:54-1355(+)
MGDALATGGDTLDTTRLITGGDTDAKTGNPSLVNLNIPQLMTVTSSLQITDAKTHSLESTFKILLDEKKLAACSPSGMEKDQVAASKPGDRDGGKTGENGEENEQAGDGREGGEEAAREEFWKFVDAQASDILGAEQFVNLSERVAVEVLCRDSLNVKEIEVAAAVLRWADAKKKGVCGQERRELLKHLLPCIRFPCLSNAEFAKLVPEELLDQAASVQLFIYLSKAKKIVGSAEELVLPEPLKHFSSTPRSFRAPWRLRFDPASGQNCTVSSEGCTATRSTSYESTIRGNAPLPDYAVSIRLRLTQETTWSGALVLGAMDQREKITQSVYGASAFYLDLWHGQVRLSGVSTPRSFHEAAELIKMPGVNVDMTMDWAPSPGGGGVLSFTCNGKPISNADLVIPKTQAPGTLVPWFGVYGRTQSIHSLDDSSGS